jgi:two-component system phosphate regulon response regulator OmpR
MSVPARVDIPDHAPHVLVVDDDRRLRDLLARFLGEHGYRVTTAASAAEARAKSESFVFDALVLDVMMPGESGFDFARRVRTDSRVPILMLTARADPADRVTGLEIGADDYLPKPFEPRELILRLGNIPRHPPPPSRSASELSRSGSTGASCAATARSSASPSASARS